MAAQAAAQQQQREPHPALSRPALLSHVFKFVVREHKDVTLVHVDSAWEDTAVNFAPWMWQRLLRSSEDDSSGAYGAFNRYVCRVWSRTCPSVLCRLVDPVVIDLSYNGCITDAAMGCIAALPTVQTLDLAGCDKITDAALQHIRGLQKLQTLNLGGCKLITDAGLLHLSRLQQLQTLNLSSCGEVTDVGLAHIASLTQLQSLNLNSCDKITDAALLHVAGLHKLQTLNLRCCCAIGDAGIAHIAQLKELTVLNLFAVGGITDAALPHIGGLLLLQELDLGCNSEITDSGLAHVGKLTALQSLGLGACGDGVTNAGVAHLARLVNLKHLDLSYCDNVNDKSMEHLKNVSALETLNVEACGISNTGVGHICKAHAATLTDLNISCSKITGRAAAHLAELTRLRRLNAESLKSLFDDDLEEICAGLAESGLEWLDLSFCELTHRGVSHVRQIKTLQTLIASSTKLDDSALQHIGSLPELRELDVSKCVELTDAGMAHLCGLRKLEDLDVSGCERLGDVALAHIAKCAALRYLSVGDCELMTEEGREEFKKTLPECLIIE